MKRFFGGMTVGLLLFACGSSPSVTERRIDSSALVLRGTKPELDLPINQANGFYCYSDDDTIEIKKYIISLEQKLKTCEQECHR